ncbi:ParA family protein (plasmid) [Deinococcus sp. KNUC1210]|uniref:ParA family protein n=1 Tax=Deinococcus sp. KNUC1210 TaxID=2917691 RepID=UPI001EF0641F|nr:ParA family protein [Deinococcus sp. KNUC1210]ULH17439.1 ParA family protein [Deinococcus sp. KNUC1210]
MKILTVFNHAGGAAKTSTVRDLGYAFAQRGFRVLLVDLDPQANLSTWLGVDAEPSQTVYQTLVENAPLPAPSTVFGLDLIPSTLGLAKAEAQLPGIIGGVTHLRDRLGEWTDRYDLVLIDSPPSLGQLSLSACLAAGALIVPVPTTHKGVGGLPAVHEMVATYRKLNPGLHIAWYVPTQYNANTSHHREVLDVLRERLTPLGSPITYRPAVYPDAHAQGMPVSAYQPGSAADTEIQRAADELEAIIHLGVQA